ncbi:hypothetical protein BDB00DRAFT_873968 [Zychaea mexicana]|uniref:uncharacterized protein n=1 Tax=Zychaea mexicana TaxID=64656 RepID=UPI0022FE8A07|nr:uncharacterized protein BDB00DRAFT_873968 [Zychaea mexicana]KAI9491758.1 hypothetical protein BDB00DRAFT_873968 [Zychaea mexicana]
MKTRVKLYTHRIKSAANGQLYDVFEVRTPYTTGPRSVRQQQQQRQQQTPASDTTDAAADVATATSTDAAAITKAFDITSTKQAYAPSYKEACMFLRAIQINRRERVSPQCLRHLATYVVQAWEVDPAEAKVTELIDVMTHLLDTTQVDTTLALDDALRQSCRNPAALPTVCPTVALLVAMRYIDRLKKKYNNIRGAVGCSHRLIVVAYMMAVKYIHANLRLIVDITVEDDGHDQQPQQQQQQKQQATAEERRRSSVDSLLFSRLSTERSTLRKPPSSTATASMVSPPASPKSCASSPEQQKKQLSSLQQQQQDSQSQRALRALRMEIEFLHFLNHDLTLSDPVGLVEWAHRRPPTTSASEQPVEPSSTPTAYNASASSLSADDGDDEMESDDDTPSVG